MATRQPTGNDAIWRIDDFYIGGDRVAPLNIEDDFTSSLPPEMWPSYAGAVVDLGFLKGGF